MPSKASSSRQGLLGIASAAAAIAMEEEGFEQMVARVLDRATDLGAKEAVLLLRDSDKEALRFTASNRPLSRRLRTYLDEVPLEDDSHFVGGIARKGVPFAVGSPSELGPEQKNLRDFMEEGGRAALVLAPLLSRGALIGLLGWTLDETQEFSDEAMEEIQGIASILAASIDTRLAWDRLRREIDERRMAEEEAKRSRVFLDLVIEGAPVGVLLVREDGTLRANATALELLGEPFDPFGGLKQLVPRFVHPDGSGFTLGEVESLVYGEEGSAWPDFFIARPGEEPFPAMGRAKTIDDAAGRSFGHVVILEDITALRELERIRSEWTALVVHDLRQPLTVISTYAGMLARRKDDPVVESKARQIVQASKALARMITDMTEASRIETRNLRLYPRDMEVETFLERVAEHFEGEECGHPLSLEIGESVPELHADPDRLEQVLWNLLTNASRYGLPGTEIVMGVGRSNGSVLFWVRNRSEGIDAEDLPKLFDRHFRALRAKESHAHGLGLGLYIAKGIVEAHGGRIWVEDRDGWVTFRFTIPVQPQEEEEAPRKVEVAPHAFPREEGSSAIGQVE